jgi:hypothetical protein
MMAKAPTTVYGEVRPAMRAMFDQGYTDEIIAQTLRKRIGHVQFEREVYRRAIGKPMPSEPSLPSVSFLKPSTDLTDADYVAGVRARQEAGL